MIIPETLLRQTRLHFPRFEGAEVQITPIEKGGSGRKFYRVQFSPEQTIVAGEIHPDSGRKSALRRDRASSSSSRKCGRRKIHFHDPEEGLIWIEDLGENDLWSHRKESWRGGVPLRIGAGGLGQTPSHPAPGFRGDSGAISRRSSTPRFIVGSSITYGALPRPSFRRRGEEIARIVPNSLD